MVISKTPQHQQYTSDQKFRETSVAQLVTYKHMSSGEYLPLLTVARVATPSEISRKSLGMLYLQFNSRRSRRKLLMDRVVTNFGDGERNMPTMCAALRLLGLLLLALAIGAEQAPNQAPAGPSIIMIIRHAEKPAEESGEKNPNLSPRGFQRADALASVIPDHFPHPDFLIATKRSKGSNRPVETITPLSKALHEEIESTFKDDEVDQVAHEVLTDPKFAGKIVLIAWHHGKIPELAAVLGVKNAPPKWNPAVFDRVWEITYQNGVANWQNLPQKVLPGDSQN